MQRQIRSIADLANLRDGLLDGSFQQVLQMAMDDVCDRPALEKPRTIAIKLLLTPHSDDSGQLVEIGVGARVTSTIPSIDLAETSARPAGAKGHAVALLFNDLSPDDHRQQTLDAVAKFTPEEDDEPEKE